MAKAMETLIPIFQTINGEEGVLKERILAIKRMVEEKESYSFLGADQYAIIKHTLINNRLIFYLFIFAECFFNYFATESLFPFGGSIAFIARVISSLVITYGLIVLLEKLFHQIGALFTTNDNKASKFNIILFIVCFTVAAFYFVMIYHVGILRGNAIEGNNGTGVIGTVMVLFGILIPLVTAFLYFERNAYLGAYKNTQCIYRLKNEADNIISNFALNVGKKESIFKSVCEQSWISQKEFATFKENYDKSKQRTIENTDGHFCNTQSTFSEEATRRLSEGQGMISSSNSNRLQSEPINSEK